MKVTDRYSASELKKKNLEQLKTIYEVETESLRDSKTYEEIESTANVILDENDSLATDEIEEDGPRKILLVEDNEMNIEITTSIIKELDYICDVAKDGIDAIKKIKEVDKNYYDLILMDIHMPRYNGYEISKIIKKDLDIKVPIVALTATTVTDQIVEENKNYIIDYILKPIKPAEFKEKIKNYDVKTVIAFEGK